MICDLVDPGNRNKVDGALCMLKTGAGKQEPRSESEIPNSRRQRTFNVNQRAFTFATENIRLLTLRPSFFRVHGVDLNLSKWICERYINKPSRSAAVYTIS